MSVSEPSDTIDKSVQLPIMMPPTCWLSTTARASAASLTPTIKSCASLSRVDICDSSAGPSPHAGAGMSTGAAGTAVAAIAGVGASESRGGRAAGHERGQCMAAHSARSPEPIETMGPETSRK